MNALWSKLSATAVETKLYDTSKDASDEEVKLQRAQQQFTNVESPKVKVAANLKGYYLIFWR